MTPIQGCSAASPWARGPLGEISRKLFRQRVPKKHLSPPGESDEVLDEPRFGHAYVNYLVWEHHQLASEQEKCTPRAGEELRHV